MSETPKRRWFQFHLSTALIFIVVAGALLGANIEGLTLSQRPKIPEGAKVIELTEYGFPIRIHFHVRAMTKEGWPYEELDSGGWGVFVNPAIPFLVAFIAESLIRRRAGRKP